MNDETVPVNVLVPAHPLFNYPNKIGPATWVNWVQERGQYFLAQKDPQYVDLISMIDSFPDNPGVKLGSLVEVEVRQGPMAVCRPWPLAPAPGRHRWRVPTAGEHAGVAEGDVGQEVSVYLNGKSLDLTWQVAPAPSRARDGTTSGAFRD